MNLTDVSEEKADSACYRLHVGFLLHLFVELETDTSVDFQRTTRRYIPDDHCCENFINIYSKMLMHVSIINCKENQPMDQAINTFYNVCIHHSSNCKCSHSFKIFDYRRLHRWALLP
jgi:hypothetical protein